MRPHLGSRKRSVAVLGAGAIVAVAVLVAVAVTPRTVDAFCDARQELTDVLDRGVRGNPGGSIGMAEDLKAAYRRIADTAPASIAPDADLLSDRNQFLADAVIEAEGDMFAVAARLPPGLFGEDLRTAETTVEAFVAANCNTD